MRRQSENSLPCAGLGPQKLAHPQQRDRGQATALQVSEFLFGDGFAVAPGDKWRVRRRAVAPSLHKAYLEVMIDRVFGPSGLQLNGKLEVMELPNPLLPELEIVVSWEAGRRSVDGK